MAVMCDICKKEINEHDIFRVSDLIITSHKSPFKKYDICSQCENRILDYALNKLPEELKNA